MPNKPEDSKPKIQKMDSGEVQVTLPTKPEGTTTVEVTPDGSREHEVSAEVNPEPPVERRRNPAPMSVNVNPPLNSGGLTGVWATVANLSAVGFVFFVFLWVYKDMTTQVKDSFSLIREESKLHRELMAESIKNVRDEMRMSREVDSKNATAFALAAHSLETKFDANNAAMVAAVSELKAMNAEAKASRMALEAKLDKLLNAKGKSDGP